MTISSHCEEYCKKYKTHRTDCTSILHSFIFIGKKKFFPHRALIFLRSLIHLFRHLSLKLKLPQFVFWSWMGQSLHSNKLGTSRRSDKTGSKQDKWKQGCCNSNSICSSRSFCSGVVWRGGLQLPFSHCFPS